MKLDHYLTPYTKINSKWIRGLNVILKTIKYLEEITSSKFFDICLSICLDQSPQAKVTKAKTEKRGIASKGKAFVQQRKPSTNEKATY